jgi:hypothetical protein
MDLVLFHDKIYGKIDKRLFLFESTWDTFRPITGVFWNGARFVSPIQNPIISGGAPSNILSL